MTREKDDPEKRNLLTEHKDDKKRRQYSGSRTKMDRRSCESSCSEHRKRGNPYKTSSTEQRAEYKQNRTQSAPYQSEKKDSWWFWQKDATNQQKKQNEDTCSCVSCAFSRLSARLKRIVSSEYACIGCLLLIFTISIIVAFLVVCKSVPTFSNHEPTTEKPQPKCKPMGDSERLKRKIEMLNENRIKNDLSSLDQFSKSEKEGYDDDLTGHIPGVSGIDFGPSFRELNSLDESESKLSADLDWSNVLETDKSSEMQSSEKLREFYRKLVQTDAKIKNLKRLNQAEELESDENSHKSPDRSKRSLKLYNYPSRYQANKRNRRSVYKEYKFNEGHLRKRQGGSNYTRPRDDIGEKIDYKFYQTHRKRQQNNTRMREPAKDPEENQDLIFTDGHVKKRQQNISKTYENQGESNNKFNDVHLKKRQQNITKFHGYSADMKYNDAQYRKRQGSNNSRAYGVGKAAEEPTGFVIEKKKLIVQYKPVTMNKKKVPVKKCSHAPKDLHVHENQLKHPFYKNTQRLDELLDRFLNKNLPEIMSDPFGLDMLFKHDKEKIAKCKHPSPSKSVNIVNNEQQLVDQIPKPKSKLKKPKEEAADETQTDFMKLLRPESSTQYEKQFFLHEEQLIGKEKQKIVTASPNDFEVLLSVSTIMNPDIKKTGKLPAGLIDKVPNVRRLMQLEGEDDENLGYEDFKEVLTDDVENHDDMDKSRDRRKREDLPGLPVVPQPPIPQEKVFKNNPPGVHNPNWKGPMPLYPDELNSMIRHAAMNANKVDVPSNAHELQSSFLERRGRDLSDVEYVEDYLNNKYDKLVEMAQAYSDYGVLDGKKDSRNEKDPASDVKATEHRVKMSPNARGMRFNLLKKLKKGRHPTAVTESSDEDRRLRQLTFPDTDEITTEQTGGIPNTFFYHALTSTKEGIRFELCPTTKAREDEDLHPLKVLSKHVKIEHCVTNATNATTTTKEDHAVHSTLISTYPDMELVYSKKEKVKKTKAKKKKLKSMNDMEKENALIFSLSKGKRNLLSTDYKSTSDAFDVEDMEDFTDRPDENLYDFYMHSMNNQRFNQTKQNPFSRYLEKMKQKNIRIYSTVHPDFSNFTSSVKIIGTQTASIEKTTTHTSEIDDLRLPPISPLDYPPSADSNRDNLPSASNEDNIPISNVDVPPYKPDQDSQQFKLAHDIPPYKPVQDIPQFKPVQDMPQFKPVQDMPQFKPVQDMPQFKPVQDMPQYKSVQDMPPFKTGQEDSPISNMDIPSPLPKQEIQPIPDILSPVKVLSVSPYNMFFARDVESTSQIYVSDTIVTINKSEISLDNIIGDNCAGKILLTVEDPEIGTERIDINFDIPLVINFNDDFMVMNESYNFRSNYSEFEMTTAMFFDPNANDTDFPMDTELEPEVYTNQGKRRRFKRNSLQSNTTDEPVKTTANTTSNSSINFNMNVKNSRSPNNTDGDMSLSEFFMMVSDWFKTLEGVKLEKDKSGLDLTEMILKFNNDTEVKISTESFPNYDSDMIENIGHRSRVLLAVETETVNETTTEDTTEVTQGVNTTGVLLQSASAGDAHNIHTDTTKPSKERTTHKIYTKPSSTSAKTTRKLVKTKSKMAKTKKKKPKAKAVVKRNADDSNLIFWNDIYDDEYGIQSDTLDNTVRDKHSVEENDFIKRSGRWVHDKIMKFAENLKINPRQEDVEIKERFPRSIKDYIIKESGVGTFPKYINEHIPDRLHRREPDDVEEEDYDTEQKSVFTALSANMKEVCKKAARAVQQTRNIEVREDSRQGTIATSLMQQLVRLLTDLVDYQVQQKTCTKLPADLQAFLEWLTQPKEMLQDSQADMTFRPPFQEEDLMEEMDIASPDQDRTTEHPQEPAPQAAQTKPGQTQIINARLHYLDCLHSVQELIEQYEDMTDDDKSKMTGVRSYLENQMRYLNKFLAGYDLFSIFEKNNKLRFKRDLQPIRRIPLKRRKRRKLNKFIRNFGKKHTRTTASYYDALQVTESRRKTNDYEIVDAKLEEGPETNEVKRNLKDVYYKAIAEAKKYATAKNLHRKGDPPSYGTSPDVMQHT